MGELPLPIKEYAGCCQWGINVLSFFALSPLAGGILLSGEVIRMVPKGIQSEREVVFSFDIQNKISQQDSNLNARFEKGFF